MKARRTAIVQPVSPVVDVHTHFGFKLKSNEQALDDFVAVMDANRIAVCVSLDGRLGSTFEDHRDFLWKKHKDRFVVFVHLDWKGQGEDEKPSTWDCHRPGFAKRSAERIHEAVTAGASGLKIFKRFGLNYKNPDGSLINIDDERWDPIWQACGEAKIPVIMHTADPAAFFDEVDATNERWEELSRHPDWIVQGSDAPSRTELLAARNRIIRRHPGTTFIGAHVANNSEDLKTVSKWLDEMPNLQVEFASRISELGRQPYTSRRFLIRYADRVMFGTDGPQPAARLNSYWRFLETRDENFPYSEKLPPPQGFWNIHGVGLPEEVLKKIYSENAARIIPGVSDRLRRFQSSEGS
ncbi:MAG: amidohydrolase family protein [Planctomycetota bacterium]